MGKKFFEAILADEDRFNRFFNLACTLLGEIENSNEMKVDDTIDRSTGKQQDTDNSGELDAAELEQTLDQFFNSDFNEKSLSADEIKALVAKFDTDKSGAFRQEIGLIFFFNIVFNFWIVGKVSKDEFKKLLREYVQKSAQ
jgi:hypothetical protein